MAESRRRNNQKSREPQEFDQAIVEVARVTRVTKGGKQMRFRACIVLGDRKGRVAQGVGKGIDVAQAISKATVHAKKNMLHLALRRDTIPFPVEEKYGAARIMLKAAPSGTGIKAGGPMRIVLELAGVPNVVGKMLGSKNKINNIRATLAALQRFVVKDSVSVA